jgi:transcriptional regulator with XRE-family HTH domain
MEPNSYLILIRRKQIGQTILKLRREQGMSQRKFAAKCGVHYSNISQIENAKTDILLSTFVAICEALEKNIKITD